eukprot:jgi/Chlat1/245/Chrsp1S03150
MGACTSSLSSCTGKGGAKTNSKRAATYRVNGTHDDANIITKPDQHTQLHPQTQVQPQQTQVVAQQLKPALDPRDFVFAGLKGEVRVKPPGSIAGQQFVIEECVDCAIFLLDCCATVTVDACRNCRVFVGPTEGSVFVRDCVDTKLSSICRQFRTRDCKGCDFALACATRPVIESSESLRFGCCDVAYAGLAEQMNACGLNPLVNFWSHVHDFTPSHAHRRNWDFLPPDLAVESLLGPWPPESCLQNPTPYLITTWGDRPPPHGQSCFFLFFPGVGPHKSLELISTLSSLPTLILQRVNAVVHARLDPDAARRLLARTLNVAPADVDKRLVNMLASSLGAVGVEACGEGCAGVVGDAAARVGMRVIAGGKGGGGGGGVDGDVASSVVITEGAECGAEFRYLGIDG